MEKFKFLDNDFKSVPSHLNICYYEDRAKFIVECIESICNDYTGYFSMDEVGFIQNCLEKAKEINTQISQLLQLPECKVKKHNWRENEDYEEYEVLANERYPLKKLLKEIFRIEDSLVKYNQRIWYEETCKENVILFQTRPLHDDTPQRKGFISSTAVIVNPKDNSWNVTYKDANYGFGYIIRKGERIIAGGKADINSSDSKDWDITEESFEGENGVKVYAEFNRGVSKICTPKVATQRLYDKSGDEDIRYNEIVICYKKPDYMIFSGGFENYVNCKLIATENGCADIPVKRIPLNINQNHENNNTLLSEKELLLLDEKFQERLQERLSYLGIDIQKFIDEAYDEYITIRQDEYKNKSLTK